MTYLSKFTFRAPTFSWSSFLSSYPYEVSCSSPGLPVPVDAVGLEHRSRRLVFSFSPAFLVGTGWSAFLIRAPIRPERCHRYVRERPEALHDVTLDCSVEHLFILPT